MPKITKPLTALQIKHLKTGTHAVGGAAGLLIRVSRETAKSWIFRAVMDGKRRDIGLGSYPTVSIEQARHEAMRLRSLIKNGINPAEEKKESRIIRTARIEDNEMANKTFRDCAEEYIPTRLAELQNEKHKQQWRNTIETYAYPSIGKLPISAITNKQIADLLAPHWNVKHETMSRVRQRIEAIFSYAIVRGYRDKSNPAIWRHNLELLLPNLGKTHRKVSHRYLPADEIPAFLELLESIDGYTSLALQFLIYTAARSGSVRHSRWNEVDWERKVWNIPAEHMKSGKAHRVPLSSGALRVLSKTPNQSGTSLIFPNTKGTALSDNTLSALMRRMDISAVPHGFRSSFSTWCATETDYPLELREAALAHQVKNMVIEAYQRSDLLDRRKNLMEDWSSKITPTR